MNDVADKNLQFDVKGLDDGNEAPLEGVSRAAVLAILRNLLENAFHYTPAGGSVTLKIQRTKDKLTMSVADTGPGIAPEERARVFDPFYRVTGTGLPGTGLGLAIVKTYADMTGAEVTLADTVPGGTPPGLTATVNCPLPPAD